MPVTSYSQLGEDLQVAYFLGRREDLTYIDVGCLWPVELSNTYFFYKRGGRGLCVDPNPDVAEWFRNDRPRDTFVSAAAGTSGTVSYVMHENPVFNTCSEDRAAEVQRKARNRGGRGVVGTTPTTVRTLDDIVEQSGFAASLTEPLDVLSVDTTGMDLDVLTGFSFEAVRPALVVTAHRSDRLGSDLAGDPLVERMTTVGYRTVGRTRSTLYFRDER